MSLAEQFLLCFKCHLTETRDWVTGFHCLKELMAQGEGGETNKQTKMNTNHRHALDLSMNTTIYIGKEKKKKGIYSAQLKQTSHFLHLSYKSRC